jgi:hyperosmotically inducible protein
MKRSMLVTLTLFSLILTPVALAAGRAKLSTSLSAQSTQSRALTGLAKEVRRELIMLPYYSVFDWLEFDVKPDGSVVLRGQVTRPTLKSDAENVVKRIESVEKVANEIEVLPLSPNDDRIRRAVYRALFTDNSPLFRYSMGAVPPIHIIVKNGNVTLKGVVGSQSDIDIATVKARGVSGVFGVKNELVIERSQS